MLICLDYFIVIRYDLIISKRYVCIIIFNRLELKPKMGKGNYFIDLFFLINKNKYYTVDLIVVSMPCRSNSFTTGPFLQ